MSVITTGLHPRLLFPGVREVWGQEYAQQDKIFDKLFNVNNSDKAYEIDVQITGHGLAYQKPQTSSVTYVSDQQGWVTTYKHIAYALGYIVSKEDIVDNKYPEVAMRRAKANAYSMNQTIETVCAAIYNNAFTTSYYTTPDAQSVISLTHSNPNGTTFSNRLTTDADLSEASLENLVIQIMTAQQNTGLFINLKPTCLAIHPSNFFNANRILNSPLQSNSTTNNINVLKDMNLFPMGIVSNPFFTDLDAWFVRTDVPNGLNFFWRTTPELEDDNDFDTKNMKHSSYMRFSAGITDALGLFGSPGI
jgi:hypothetical protein